MVVDGQTSYWQQMGAERAPAATLRAWWRHKTPGTTFAADWYYEKQKRGSCYGCKCLKTAFMDL